MKKKALWLLIAAAVILAVVFVLPKTDGGLLSDLGSFDPVTLLERIFSDLGSDPAQPDNSDPQKDVPKAEISESGWYSSKDEVALYIHTYGKLPGNYISKSEAEKLGWSGGSLEPYAKGKSIGGSPFGNYEGLLPAGHKYTECDIDTAGKSSRGTKRIVFSDDGLIYYTDDHYETFTLLYGGD